MAKKYIKVFFLITKEMDMGECQWMSVFKTFWRNKSQRKQTEEATVSEGTSAKEGAKQNPKEARFKNEKWDTKGGLQWKSVQWTAILLPLSR